MSCCGGGSSMGGDMSMMEGCPVSICCNLFKTMTDPCSQMLDRNIKRNVYGQVNNPSWAPPCPRCPSPQPKCCERPCSLSPCCPAPRLTVCKDSCQPCCQQMNPCPPKCPTVPCFTPECCPPPCCPPRCLARKQVPAPCRGPCSPTPPCCPSPRRSKCCVPQICCLPPPCPQEDDDPCQQPPCCPSVTLRPVPTRSNCCPPPPTMSSNRQSQCPTPCCNPLPPCCVMVKPCQPRCAPSPCCPPPPMCGIGCPRPDPRCCPKPVVVSFKCPTAQCPMNPRGVEDGCSEIRCPVIRADDSGCCPRPGPPRQTEMCMMNVQTMPSGCGCPPSCNDDVEVDYDCACPTDCCSSADPAIACSKRLIKPRNCNSWRQLCCRPTWNKSVKTKFEYVVNHNFPCLPTLSCRYKQWICSEKPLVDSNLCPSRFSSRRENNCLIRALPTPYNCDPCPCHC